MCQVSYQGRRAEDAHRWTLLPLHRHDSASDIGDNNFLCLTRVLEFYLSLLKVLVLIEIISSLKEFDS